ncbi:MAG: 50S ribosomal protein L17 [Candidatus Omnitrophica bacterium]|nr:50S ribosomal protein L17 [Candidatus Omnitrophota bacterium]
MPHSVYTRNLGRSRSWRKATVRSLTSALLKHEQIETTLARAKETQRLAERLITLGKSGSLSSRRRALSLLDDTAMVARLFSEIAPRFTQRPGGYTRILHGNHRPGDGASMAVLELVERTPQKTAKPKGKVKEEVAPPSSAPPKPKSAEKPKVEPPKKEEPRKPEKPKGFLEGLRSIFKKDRKDRPKNP